MTAKTIEMCVMQQGGLAFPYASNWNDIVQASNTPVTYDVAALRTAAGLPAGQSLFLIFSADAPFWANFYGTAALPSAGVTNGTASEFAPNQRYIDSTVTAISFIAANNANISIQVFRP